MNMVNKICPNLLNCDIDELILLYMVEKLENSIITSFSLKSTRAKYSRVTLVINYNNSNRKKKENQQIEKCKMLLSNAKLENFKDTSN